MPRPWFFYLGKQTKFGMNKKKSFWFYSKNEETEPVFHELTGELCELYISGLPVSCSPAEGCEPVAYLYPVSRIFTDPQRFQNRQDSYSETSAQAVAENFDPNKFDPIVVWYDSAEEKIFVLSGHSRLEGMKRRKESHVPIRFFTGDEGDAIIFSRIEANRAATKENLIEDLKAYKLARDGDLSRGIAPSSPAKLKEQFRGKEGKLKNYSFLDPKGKFISALADEDSISQFPRVQSFAEWTGILRRQFPTMTNTHEDDIFNFLYGNSDHIKLPRQNFEELIKERLAFGKERLFPECLPGEPCKEIKDWKELSPPAGPIYKEIAEIQKDLDQIRNRLSQPQPAPVKIYTEEEKKALREVFARMEQKQKNLKRDIGIIEQTAPALFGPEFGLDEDLNFVFYLLADKKKFRYFSTSKTVSEARREIKQIYPKNTKILRYVKI